MKGVFVTRRRFLAVAGATALLAASEPDRTGAVGLDHDLGGQLVGAADSDSSGALGQGSPRYPVEHSGAADQRLSRQVHCRRARRVAAGHRRPGHDLGLDRGRTGSAAAARRPRRAVAGRRPLRRPPGRRASSRACSTPVPNRSGPGVYYYNKTVFDKAGVPYPVDGWTYARPARDLAGAHHPGRAVRHRRSGRHQRSVERLDAVRPDPLVYGRRLPDAPTVQRAGDQQPRERRRPSRSGPISTSNTKSSPEGTPNFTTTRDIQPLFEANKVGC